MIGDFFMGVGRLRSNVLIVIMLGRDVLEFINRFLVFEIFEFLGFLRIFRVWVVYRKLSFI